MKEKFTKQIAFNVIPHIDVFLEDGQTKEEWKMYNETKKILDQNIELTATCVRVPVFISHSLAVNIEFEKPYDEDHIREIFKESPGLKMIDYRADEGYVTPIESAGLDPVLRSRIFTPVCLSRPCCPGPRRRGRLRLRSRIFTPACLSRPCCPGPRRRGRLCLRSRIFTLA